MAGKRRSTAQVLEVRPAGPEHQVVTVEGARTLYRRRPCSDCPWRIDATGEFPPEAFVHSASTAYDMAQNTFACHQVGAQSPAICAGFLLRGADHNLAVRLHRLKGTIVDDVCADGVELHESYRDMAVANGVSPEHPALRSCR